MQDKDLYVLAELKYKDLFKDKSDVNVFPDNWYLSKDYVLKNNILAEAIQKQVLIIETDLYKQFFSINSCNSKDNKFSRSFEA